MLETNNIYLGDSLELMRQMPDKSVDIILTDPPFDKKTHEGARTAARQKIDYHRKTPGVLVDFEPYTLEKLYAFLELAATKTKTWVVFFCDWHYMNVLEEKPPAGLRFVRFGVWIKPNGAPQFTGDRPGQGWEAVAIMHTDGGRMEWNGGGHHGVWIENKAHQDSYPGAHTTVKPQPLLCDMVTKFSNENDIVLDPFAGSGSHCIACIKTNRRFIGMEILKQHYDTAKMWADAELSQYKLAL